MSDLIDRQAALSKFEPWLKVPGYSEGERNMLKAVLYELRFLPSAQPDFDTLADLAAAKTINEVEDCLNTYLASWKGKKNDKD